MGKSAILIEASPGELLDKISILEIKAERITDKAKLANINHELSVLTKVKGDSIATDAVLDALFVELRAVNAKIWNIEDAIRDKERVKSFDAEFVELARSVYINNDHRADIKRRINTHFDSAIVEEKSYSRY